MIKKNIRKILGFGLLLLVIWNIVLFIISIIFRFETNPPVAALVTFAVLMAIVTFSIVRLQKPQNIKLALTYSISWTFIVYVIEFLITIPNGTTKIFFSNWAAYLGIVLMAFSPYIWPKFKK